MQVAALVSGGVDSSVTIPLLKEQGYDPVIFYIKISMEGEPGFVDCPQDEDIEIVTWIAKKYGCRFEIADLKQEYWDRVVAYTLESVKAGFTPNPDIMCNLMIKFGAFEEKFGHHFDRIATGHYANVFGTDGKKFLATAKDRVKDQTYFLSRITSNQLSKLMFPIGNLLKSEVRSLAHQMKLPSAHRPDSQGICFLGKINYSEFIRKYTGEKEGKIVELETGKILGMHKGYWFHTIGQRKGLGLSQGPWFVVKKDIAANVVYVSQGYDPEAQYGNCVSMQDFRFITENPFKNLAAGVPVKFKIRHTPEFTQGILWSQEDGYRIDSSERIAGIAPGQFGVVYDLEEKLCLGAGMISDNPNS